MYALSWKEYHSVVTTKGVEELQRRVVGLGVGFIMPSVVKAMVCTK